MAKTKGNRRYWRVAMRGNPARKLHVEVKLHPASENSFRACARVKSKIELHSFNAPKGYYQCAIGSNPRKAVAAALRALSKRLVKRKGAFAGVK